MIYDNRSVSVGSASIGYRIEGEGARKILLLHGLNSHSGTWRKNISALARDATVVAPSLPPHRGGGTPGARQGSMRIRSPRSARMRG